MSKKLTVTINQTELPVKEYQGQRVVTLKEIDAVHERPEGTARKRFNDNKKHFIDGTDYFVRNPDEAMKEFGIIAPNGLTLITESGYLMLVKSFKVGRVANEHHLKIPEYGVQVWDKAKNCEKQVSSWRYNDKGVARMREILREN